MRKPNIKATLKLWNDIIEYNAAFPILAANPMPMVILMYQVIVAYPIWAIQCTVLKAIGRDDVIRRLSC